MEKINPTTTQAWKKLLLHFEEIRDVKMKDMFEGNPNRFQGMSVQFEGILLDYSKNRLDSTTLGLLRELAKEMKLKEAIDAFFSGEKYNLTENRSVLHMALRAKSDEEYKVKGENVMPLVEEALEKMRVFSEKIISGKWKGHTGKEITDVVNIGIGGSDLGPYMVIETLKPYKTRLNMHFVSNVDSSHIVETLKPLNPETTLFLIASKTFTTQETLENALSARDWLLSTLKDDIAVAKHFVAISTNTVGVTKFGIDPANMFEFWDWVGGRYSLWSSIGLSIVLGVGFDNFKRLLNGANAMDRHFKTADFSQNIPVILALVSIWYNNFFKTDSHVFLPYDQYFGRFAYHIRQVDMESNGKYVDRNGKKVDYQTGPIIWGEPGTNGQHAFYQLIHQGTKLIPCEFFASVHSHNPLRQHHDILLSNFFAQTQALAFGKDEASVRKDLAAKGMTEDEIQKVLVYKIFEGNRPSNSILVKIFDPETMGAMIAMYEHKVFAQGILWNIFSFDQMGVELGKELANKLLPKLVEEEKVTEYDSSTNGLINFYLENKNIQSN